jgi:hypothetical protein
MAIRARKLNKNLSLDSDAQAWLRNKPCGFFEFKPKAELLALWHEHSDEIVAEHVADNPGTRPARWWKYDAPRSPLGTYSGCGYDGELPEPRKRLGGTGRPAYEVKCFMPTFQYGVPDIWVGIDEDDLPIYESEAAYLKRHGLLLAGEGRRCDFEQTTYVPKSLDWFSEFQ